MEIKVNCKTGKHLKLDQLLEFQGNLKSLSTINYKKLKGKILKFGFCEPVSVWYNDENNYILNGHQRVRTLKIMRDEGYDIPFIPVNYIQASSAQEAAQIVLALTSQYGKLESDGLYEFMNSFGIDMDTLQEYNFPEINLDKFAKEFIEDGAIEESAGKLMQCPSCGHEW